MDADPEFESDVHPGLPSPAALAAGPGARPVTPGTPRSDVTVGQHPEHGITAAAQPGTLAARLLAKAGFTPVPGQSALHLLPERTDAAEHTRDVVAELRALGLTVHADGALEPLPQGQDPFATVVADTRTAPVVPPAPVEDPFATRLISAAALEPARPQPAVADPFATELTPGAQAQDSRMGALLAHRIGTLATVEEILDELSQTLRDAPESLDPAQVNTVIGQAQATLGGVGRDLAAIAAAAPARAPRAPRSARTAAPSPVLGARAQAATATSLRLGRVTATQPVEAAAQPVDPRPAYGLRTR